MRIPASPPAAPSPAAGSLRPDAPGMEASFSSLLDQLVTCVLPILQPAQRGAAGAAPAATTAAEGGGLMAHIDVAAALLSHADRMQRLIAPALASASSMPLLIELATTLLGSCAVEGAMGVDPALDFLSGLASAARSLRVGMSSAGSAGSDEALVGELRARLAAGVCGKGGAALVRACVFGLAESLPPSAVPRVANVLAPLLHLDGWRVEPGAPPGAPPPLHTHLQVASSKRPAPR